MLTNVKNNYCFSSSCSAEKPSYYQIALQISIFALSIILSSSSCAVAVYLINQGLTSGAISLFVASGLFSIPALFLGISCVVRGLSSSCQHTNNQPTKTIGNQLTKATCSKEIIAKQPSMPTANVAPSSSQQPKTLEEKLRENLNKAKKEDLHLKQFKKDPHFEQFKGLLEVLKEAKKVSSREVSPELIDDISDEMSKSLSQCREWEIEKAIDEIQYLNSELSEEILLMIFRATEASTIMSLKNEVFLKIFKLAKRQSTKSTKEILLKASQSSIAMSWLIQDEVLESIMQQEATLTNDLIQKIFKEIKKTSIFSTIVLKSLKSVFKHAKLAQKFELYEKILLKIITAINALKYEASKSEEIPYLIEEVKKQKLELQNTILPKIFDLVKKLDDSYLKENEKNSFLKEIFSLTKEKNPTLAKSVILEEIRLATEIQELFENIIPRAKELDTKLVENAIKKAIELPRKLTLDNLKNIDSPQREEILSQIFANLAKYSSQNTKKLDYCFQIIKLVKELALVKKLKLKTLLNNQSLQVIFDEIKKIPHFSNRFEKLITFFDLIQNLDIAQDVLKYNFEITKISSDKDLADEKKVDYFLEIFDEVQILKDEKLENVVLEEIFNEESRKIEKCEILSVVNKLEKDYPNLKHKIYLTAFRITNTHAANHYIIEILSTLISKLSKLDINLAKKMCLEVKEIEVRKNLTAKFYTPEINTLLEP